jgi:EpsI family protein
MSKFAQVKVAFLLMVLTLILSTALKPSERRLATAQTFDIDLAIPKSFGTWTHDGRAMVAVVNPETKALLDKIYSQIVNRTYVNGAGQSVMLSIAYGSDQRGAMQAHKPEVCYPAQGFSIRSLNAGSIITPIGKIETTRMTAIKANRFESVTYWFTIGDQQAKTNLERRFIEIKSVLTGQIPDGLLFRVSSIGGNSNLSFEIQDDFTKQLMSAVPPATRTRLAGL